MEKEKGFVAIILLVLMVAFVIFAIGFTIHMSVNAPCSEFENIDMRSVPARCLNYFTQPK